MAVTIVRCEENTKLMTEKISKGLAKIFNFGLEDFSVEESFEAKKISYKSDKNAIRLVLKSNHTPRYVGKGGVIGMVENLKKLFSKSHIEEGEFNLTRGCDTCDYGTFYTRSFVLYDK